MQTNALVTSSAATELAHQVFQQQQVVSQLQNTTEQQEVVDVHFRTTAEKEQQCKWTEFIRTEAATQNKNMTRLQQEMIDLKTTVTTANAPLMTAFDTLQLSLETRLAAVERQNRTAQDVTQTSPINI